MDKNIQERIAAAIDTLCEGNRSEFCRRIGIKADAVKDIIGGRGTAPSYDLIYDICSSDLGISPTWLILGIGDMLASPIQPHAPSVSIGTIQTVNIANWGDLVELLRQHN